MRGGFLLPARRNRVVALDLEPFRSAIREIEQSIGRAHLRGPYSVLGAMG